MRIPLFPLHLVAFPGSAVPVYVFEMRYRVMMEHVLAGDRRAGMVAIERGREAGGFAHTYPVGTLADVERVQRAADGTMAVVFRAAERVRIAGRLPDDPYPLAEVEILPEPAGDAAPAALSDARAAVRRYLAAVARVQGQEVVAPASAGDVVAASYALAGTLDVDIPVRQSLLEQTDATSRLSAVARIARTEAALLTAIGPSASTRSAAISDN